MNYMLSNAKLAFLLTSLIIVLRPSHAVTVTEVFGEGWRCRLMPNSIYGPGVIYEDGPSGIRLVTDLTSLSEFKTRSGEAKMGIITDTREISSELKIGILSKLVNSVRASLGGALKKSQNSVIEYEIDNYVVTEADAPEIAKAWLKSKNFKPDVSKRYFLIREAISAKAMSYMVEDNVLGRLGVDLKANRVLNLKGDVIGAKADGGYYLRRNLSPSLWACSVADEIYTNAALTGDAEWKHFRTPQSEGFQNDLK